MFESVDYWLKDQPVQNFGDSLSRILIDKLFLPIGHKHIPIRIIGSCLDDWFIEQALEKNRLCKPIFWGCGIRERGGLSPLGRKSAEITAVRGPISAFEISDSGDTPIGDPSLLLPFVYQPSCSLELVGKSICIPHFHDSRTDEDVLALSGCDAVVRPNIGDDKNEIYGVIDAICSADFVLSSSLHGAIVAAAYDKPFCFWEPGIPLDIPLKWEDFAASVKIPVCFASDVSIAREIYDSVIRYSLKTPALAPLARSAPYIVKSDTYRELLDRDKEAGYISNIELTSDYSSYLEKTNRAASNPLMCDHL